MKKEPIVNRIAAATGYGKTVDTLGSLGAKVLAPKNARQFVPTPTKRDVAGAAIDIGTTVAGGALAKAGVKAASRLIKPAAKVINATKSVNRLKPTVVKARPNPNAFSGRDISLMRKHAQNLSYGINDKKVAGQVNRIANVYSMQLPKGALKQSKYLQQVAKSQEEANFMRSMNTRIIYR